MQCDRLRDDARVGGDKDVTHRKQLIDPFVIDRSTRGIGKRLIPRAVAFGMQAQKHIRTGCSHRLEQEFHFLLVAIPWQQVMLGKLGNRAENHFGMLRNTKCFSFLRA